MRDKAGWVTEEGAFIEEGSFDGELIPSPQQRQLSDWQRLPPIARFLCVSISLLSSPLTLLAGPYRVLMYTSRTFGNFGTGVLTWIGILPLYLIFSIKFTTHSQSRDKYDCAIFLTLIVVAFIKMWVTFCSNKPRPREDTSHLWLGFLRLVFLGEFIVAIFASVLLWVFCGEGAGLYFFAGYVCSAAQVGLAKIRSWCETVGKLTGLLAEFAGAFKQSYASSR